MLFRSGGEDEYGVLCTANPGTRLEPLTGAGMEKYVTNGIELDPGITVGELSRRIMEGIYGGEIKMEEGPRKEVAA